MDLLPYFKNLYSVKFRDSLDPHIPPPLRKYLFIEKPSEPLILLYFILMYTYQYFIIFYD
nr:MAG TPA: hypothetical protein [Caudoviricetes sp.]